MPTSITRPNDILEDEYNRYPYQSFPFAQSHPGHLFTLGTLFGMSPAPIEKARVLELGCASGGNIIPLAHHYPDAQYIGIDLADKQIQEGLKNIDELRLKNIQLRHQSILDFNASEGKFDYIICHGVYSWVDDEVRDKIYKICHENLAPNGIAYISYNTFPGWNMVNSVRDLMLWHTKSIDDPASKALQARLILKFITDGLQKDTSPYAEFLKSEINLLMKHADSYLLHDHLSSYNDPVYFYQFMDKANSHKLAYLSDAFPAMMFTENLPPVFSDELKKINNIIIAGQYMDFIRNQRFRATLLCHDNVVLNRQLKTNDIEKFYLQFIGQGEKPILTEDDVLKNQELTFGNASTTLKVRNLISRWGMYFLYNERERQMHFDELCSLISEKTGEKDNELIKKYLDEDLNLMRATLAGLVSLSSYPDNFTMTISEKPIACPLVRYQATKQPFVTNRRHQAARLDALGLTLLPYLDGKHDHASLAKIILKEVKAGKLSIVDKDKQPIKDETILKKYAQEFCNKALENFAKQALLISTTKPLGPS